MRGTAVTFAGAVAIALSVPVNDASAIPAINYGDFDGNTVIFQSIIEDSATDPSPLYGAPSLVGDTLDFNPTSFGSFSTGGAADITDGVLHGRITAKPGFHIESLSFSEFGDYTLVGPQGTSSTSASIGQTFFVKVVEVDGIALGSDAFTLVGQVSFTSDGDFFLPDDAGTAVPWLGSGNIDIAAGLAAQKAQFPGVYGDRVTGIEFSASNTLATTSEIGTAAFIQKQDVTLAVVTVPEPAALSLLSIGVGTMMLRRRRF